MQTSEKADRLRVMWNKSRNYFQSFLTELGEVRKMMGNDRVFARWCVEELHISIGVITNTANILKKADADIARAELQGVKDAEKVERNRKRVEAAMERERVRALKRAKAEADNESKRRENKKKRDRDYRRRMKQKKLENYIALAPRKVDRNVVQFPDGQLAKEIKVAVKELAEARSAWVDASIKLASLLYEARGRFPNDKAFGEWLVRNDIHISRDDRAALIGFGANVESMRHVLSNTERSSYQLIWRDVQRQLLAE